MTSESSTRPSRVVRRLPLILGTLAVVAAGLYGYGRLYGPWVFQGYFSPDKFAGKYVNYRLIPFLEIPVGPAREGEYKTPIMEYLHQEGFVPPSDREGVRWHFTSGSRPHWKGWHGRAHSLAKILNDDTLEWSKLHPEHARLLWPMVVELARKEEYYAAGRVIYGSVESGHHQPLHEYKEELEILRRSAMDEPDESAHELLSRHRRERARRADLAKKKADLAKKKQEE